MNHKTIAIIQARMGSTRLPGKVMLEVGHLPVIAHVVERVRRATTVDKVVVAIPDTPEDADILEVAYQHGAEGYMCQRREGDVLGRYYEAAMCYRAHVIVRITADCPFIDPHVIDRVVDALGPQPDGARAYASNIIVRTMPDGLDCEAFTFGALLDAHLYATEPDDREHVTPWILRNIPDQTSLEDPIDRSRIRWTLDTQSDYDWFRWVALVTDTTPPHPTTSELLATGHVARANS